MKSLQEVEQQKRSWRTKKECVKFLQSVLYYASSLVLIGEGECSHLQNSCGEKKDQNVNLNAIVWSSIIGAYANHVNSYHRRNEEDKSMSSCMFQLVKNCTNKGGVRSRIGRNSDGVCQLQEQVKKALEQAGQVKKALEQAGVYVEASCCSGVWQKRADVWTLAEQFGQIDAKI